jgi:tetratricopeptide (TPR) repeat protein
MRQKLIFIIFLGLLFFMAPSQKVSVDTLLKRVEFEIYKNPDKAIKTADSLLQLKKNIDDQISIYLVLSNANIAKRNFDESLKYSLKAKALTNETSNIPKKISVLFSVAVQYQQMDLFNKSFETLDLFDEALIYYNDNPAEKSFQTAKSLGLRGMIYKSQGNFEIALQKFLSSIENFEKSKQDQPTFLKMSVIYYNIGYCYLNLKNLEKAGQYFEKSHQFALKTKAKSLEAFALKGWAETYIAEEQNAKAIQLLEKAEQISTSVGDLMLNEGIYKLLADNYLYLNNTEKYQIYHKKYLNVKFEREQSELKSINRSINSHSEEKLNQLKEIKNQYQFERIIMVSIGFITFFILLFFIRKRWLQNRKIKKEIKKLF